MPSAHDFEPGLHLRMVMRRWRAQELTLRAELAVLIQAHEQSAQQARWERADAVRSEAAGSICGAELQAEVDAMAIELSHIRLALQGAAEELASLQAGGPAVRARAG